MTNSKHPKIIVLGIDGLEYDLVTEWRLKNLMQTKYCKLSLSDYKVIVTPPIWGSMLTGIVDKEIIDVWNKYVKLIGNDEKLGEKKWVKILGLFVPKKLGIWVFEHLFAPAIGGDPFETTANYVKDKNLPTILNFFQNPWTNGIPSYGKNVSGPVQKKYTERAIAGEKKPYRKYILEQYQNDKSQFFSALDKQEFDFIFWYTSMLDNLGHMDMGKPLTLMMKHYLEINEFVGIVKERCPTSIIYIISDHGMERMEPKKTSWGMHSDHAFFSSSTGETIEKPSKLYDLISKHESD